MVKTIIKELIIFLLLVLAVVLVLGVLLYEYVPATKVMPDKVSYTTPQEVQEELLQSDGIDESQVILTYEVNPTDLLNAQKVKDYKAGKSNPFSAIDTQEGTTNGTTSQTSGNTGTQAGTNSETTNSSSNTTNENEQNTSSGEGIYSQNKGAK